MWWNLRLLYWPPSTSTAAGNRSATQPIALAMVAWSQMNVVDSRTTSKSPAGSG